ncbi:phage integrase N-terminal SAM-like domain-containing protein [Desulforhopalus vacuolatus]|uniref:phage integrase N-terminal SAM-like domain-containing protein n=1 Tax=Desulforhopalus vacuolatus TaxID=40414 RepID=UPI0034DE57DE
MENKLKFIPYSQLKLMDQVREPLRYSHYARLTEKTYCQWILRYIYFYGKKCHPKYMGQGYASWSAFAFEYKTSILDKTKYLSVVEKRE